MENIRNTIYLMGLLLLLMAITACNLNGNATLGNTYEITESDVFAIKDVKGNEISVFGVRLGDSFDDLIEKIGQPDKTTGYVEMKSINLEYGQKLGMDGTGLLIHLENDKITRITFKTQFNKFLTGKTIINKTKGQVYGQFGIPEEFGQNSFFRTFSYKKRGIDIFLDKGVQQGFSIFMPVKDYVPKREFNSTERSLMP